VVSARSGVSPFRAGAGGRAPFPFPPLRVRNSYLAPSLPSFGLEEWGTLYLFHPLALQVARGGMAALKDRQKCLDQFSIDPRLKRCLYYWLDLLSSLEPRDIMLVNTAQCHRVMYSDAFWEPDQSAPLCIPQAGRCLTGLGACFYDRDGLLYEGAAIVPLRALTQLLQRETQIIACELYAVIGGLHSASHLIMNRKLIIFCDNITVACALAKGDTSCPDMAQMITDTHSYLNECKCQWWIEWIPSAHNPADILSRLGPYRHGVHLLSLPDWIY